MRTPRRAIDPSSSNDWSRRRLPPRVGASWGVAGDGRGFHGLAWRADTGPAGWLARRGGRADPADRADALAPDRPAVPHDEDPGQPGEARPATAAQDGGRSGRR